MVSTKLLSFKDEWYLAKHCQSIDQVQDPAEFSFLFRSEAIVFLTRQSHWTIIWLPSAPAESRTDLEESHYALLMLKSGQSRMQMPNDKQQ